MITAVSGLKLYDMLGEYSSNQNAYREISARAAVSDDDFLSVDFDELKKANPDVIGWIRYKGTPIDYPIVQGRDNNSNLFTRFDGSYSIFGTLFADAATEEPFRQFNTIVYGHHMSATCMCWPMNRARSERQRCSILNGEAGQQVCSGGCEDPCAGRRRRTENAISQR